MEFKVAFGQSTDEAKAQTFPLRTYTVRTAMDLSAPRVKQASGTAPSQQLNPVAAKDALTVVLPEYGVQPGDQVRVTWAGTTGGGSHTTPARALPSNREIDIPVSVLAYNLGKPVTVTYTVIRNGETFDPSAALNLAVQTFAPGDLADSTPRIPQAANNGEGSELNMNDFTGDVQVRIDGWPHVAVNQYVWLRLKGFKADGSVHDRTLWAAPSWVTPSEYERGYLLATVPSHYLQDLGDSSTLTLEFKVAFGQSTDEANAQTFPLRTYTFRTAMDLSAPRVKQASGTAPSQQLNPVAAKEALTVVLPEYGVQPGDQVRVTWAGTTGGGSHTTPARALPPNREIDIPVSVLAYNLGKPVTVTYTVIRNGETFDPSAALNLAVQTFAPGDLSDSTPRIPQATNNGEGSELNMNNYTGDAKVRIEGWPHIAVGQYVWLRLKGFQADSSEHNLTIWQPPSRVTQGEYDRNELLVTAPYNYLKNLGDSSTLTVEFKVNFSKATDEANAQTFPLRTYTVIQVVVPTLESVSGGDKEIPEGYVTYSTTLQLVGRASKGQKVEIFEGSGSDAVSKGRLPSIVCSAFGHTL
ncbi:hypothetical protein C0J56_21945 [Pseudomonas fluorescens]|nr:hypothetical protein C0J56_21945 [Pseudomonas fluorescens]